MLLGSVFLAARRRDQRDHLRLERGYASLVFEKRAMEMVHDSAYRYLICFIVYRTFLAFFSDVERHFSPFGWCVCRYRQQSNIGEAAASAFCVLVFFLAVEQCLQDVSCSVFKRFPLHSIYDRFTDSLQKQDVLS